MVDYMVMGFYAERQISANKALTSQNPGFYYQHLWGEHHLVL